MRVWWLAFVVGVGGLFVGGGVAVAAPQQRPPSVPEEFVATPHGYFHPSCVVALEEEEEQEGDGVVDRHGKRRALPVCGHPHYGHDGKVKRAEMPDVNGWVEWSAAYLGDGLSSLQADWKVPAAPARVDGQILYFFPGAQPDSGARIVQPVLGWNQIGIGPSWTVAGWNCCVNGTVTHGPFVSVAPGTTVSGQMSVRSGSRWTLSFYRRDRRGTTLLTRFYTSSEKLTWTVAAAFEVYGVATCDELPADLGAAFTSVRATTLPWGTPVSPAWSSDVAPVTPACNYRVTPSGSGAVTLSYQNF